MKKTVKFTETVLRDANQSLIATRMAFDEFEPILSELDNAGYYSLECWGGATFDSCLRYLNEDPWERLRKIKKACPKTPLQMLLRGQNLLGYKHYPDDVVRMFVRKSVENGIDIIRIFDALNDIRNIEVAVDETLKCGAHASGCICYTISPIHNLESYVKLAKEIEALGVQSICVKDMAGIMSPKEAYDLVTALKKEIKVPIVIHTHNTTGLGPMTLMKAVEAGADVIDTAVSCFSGGTSQPPTERSMPVTGAESRSSQPFTTAVSASASAYSHGLTMAAVGAYSAAVTLSLTFGSNACTSSAVSSSMPGTPLARPCWYSFSRWRSSSSPKASTNEPISSRSTSSFSHNSLASATPRTLVSAIRVPGVGSYPACRIALLALVVTLATSFLASSTSTRQLYRLSS